MLTKESIAEDVKVDPLGGQSLREELETAAKVHNCSLKSPRFCGIEITSYIYIYIYCRN